MQRSITFLVVSLVAATAVAEPREKFGSSTGYIVVESELEPDTSPHAFSRILYLNRCAGGCSITQSGSDNSSQNQSTTGYGTVPAFQWGDAKWNEVVACVREIFGPFNVTVTDVNPGATEHMEAIVGGTHANMTCPCQGGQDCCAPGVLGIAPMRIDCGVIDRSMSYTFANDSYFSGGGGNVNQICSTIGQEVAHTLGLDHELLASDPMTYLPYSGRRHFGGNGPTPQAGQCGENQPRTCRCGGSTQNSYNDLLAIFGSSAPTPPVVDITSPMNGAGVQDGFSVTATITEDALVIAELLVDGTVVDMTSAPPYTFTGPMPLAEGSHTVVVRARDAGGQMGQDQITVVKGAGCDDNADCQGPGMEGYVCMGMACVPGSGTPGGLGSPCMDSAMCMSGVCSSDGENSYCTSPCNLEANDCPGGFYCASAGAAGGVCWPGDGEGGICAAGGKPADALPIAVGIGFAMFVGRRRRRR
jgi:hypothetical protein